MRRTWKRWVPAAAAALALTMAGVGQASKGRPLDARARIGLAIAPLPLDLRGKNHEQVGLGSYLINTVGACNSCHATSEFAPGGDPFKGEPKQVNTAAYLLGGRAFGPTISRNLRPEAATGLPAGQTLGEFVQAMRHGTDFDNPGRLLQVMPWTSFQDMTDEDLMAIYAYLSSLPPVPGGH